MTGIGHNSASADDTFDVSEKELARADIAADELLAAIEHIERLEEEKKGIGDDIKDKYTELKAKGYDTKITRRIIALRKMKPEDRQEMEHTLESYKAALGMS